MATLSEIDERRFGRDGVLPPLGQTVQHTASGDWPTVAGRENLRGALARAAVTSPGDLVHRPLYGGGLLARVETPDTDVVRALLTGNIRASTLADERVEDVSVDINEDPTVAARVIVDLVVTPLGDESSETVRVMMEV